MRRAGWVLVVFGVIGAAACAFGIHMTRETDARLEGGATEVAARARELLDVVDARLALLPKELTALSEEKNPGPVVATLAKVEGSIRSAHEVTTSALRLLEAVGAMRPAGSDTPPQLGALRGMAETLLGLAQAFREQIENVSTWTLRFAVIEATVGSVREQVAETRAETDRLEADVLGTLGTITFWVIAFLVWMGLGQITLAIHGRRYAAGAAR